MVHLRSVRLRGFKTFAKPTELTFEPGITVIIGPNGSGKSNLADAVLWVLGEQSPANLRGRSMQDVIFSGAGGRRSSAVTEVSLVFDNGGGTLPLDCTELEVTRRLERDAGSLYRLNGSECRLLDIQDLVGALGLGREMHSVISQGKVEALLNSSPETRRAMVEEAAGLGRFKKRRERAQVKLDRTAQNLLRVADIEAEVKTALRPLRQQVAAAERFAEATEEWASALARKLLREVADIGASEGRVQEELDLARTGLTGVGEKMAELRRQRASEEDLFTQALKDRERLGNTFHQARALAEYLSGRTASLRQRVVRLEGDLDRARRRRDLARSESVSLRVRASEVMAGSADENRLARVNGWTETLRTALERALPEFRAAAASEDDLKDTVFELEAARSRAVQDREFLRREMGERARIGRELSVLMEEAKARLSQAEEEAENLRAALSKAEEGVQQAETGLEEAASARDATRATAETAAKAEAALAEVLAGVASREAVLRDILDRREGVPAGARELLLADPKHRLLSEVLTVEPGYERALAAALGPLAQAVSVPGGYDLSRVFDLTGVLEVVRESSGHGNVERAGSEGADLGLIPGRPATPPPAGTRDLWELVSGPEPLMSTLQRLVPATAVVEAGASEQVWPGTGTPMADFTGWRIVTPSGELLQGGIHAARRRDVGVEGLLTARNELAAVVNERAELVAQQEDLRRAALEAAAEVGKADEAYREHEERLRLAERRLAAQRAEEDLQLRRIEEGKAQLAELTERRDRQTALVEETAAEVRAVEEAMAAGEAGLEEARVSLRSIQARLETMRVDVGRLEEKKSQAALVEVKLRERCRAQASERARVESLQQAADRELQRCERRVEAIERYLPVLTELLALGESLTERSQTVAAGLESEFESVRAGTEGTARVMRDWGSAEMELQRDYDILTARVTDCRVEAARLEDRKTQLEEELAELRRKHLSPRGLKEEDVAGVDAGTLSAAVERAERRREKIGPINPLAEQECAEMEERARFLAEQRADLEASMSQLRGLIQELDEHIESSFTQIFEAARENFSAVVASVFPGAKGTLTLIDAAPAARPASVGGSDGLDEAGDEEPGRRAAGIGLEVKFPNKAPRSLSLLSGGEKAMTAIAFLFALFLARPCPFYILDEVEASLDDINIRRFLSLVRKYRDKTQFIIITHQRQTMEVADTLYGVTLESDGTSRVLSRRLNPVKGA